MSSEKLKGSVHPLNSKIVYPLKEPIIYMQLSRVKQNAIKACGDTGTRSVIRQEGEEKNGAVQGGQNLLTKR